MKRALLFGILCWIFIFVEVSVIGFTPGLSILDEHGFTLQPLGITVHFLILIGLALFLSKQFYKKPVGGLSPLLIGVIVIGTGFVLDALVTVPFFVKDYGHYYSKWTLWAGAALFVVVFAWIGKGKVTKVID